MRRRNILIQAYVALLSLILMLSLTALLSQTVLATTYVINDGDRVVTYTSFATDPAEVLGQAGVPLEEYDTYTTEAAEDGSTITVNRAQHITVHYRGQIMEVAGFGETVEQLLRRLGLELTGEDVVSHGLEEKTYDGMVLTVRQVVTRRETFSSVITHETQYCTDTQLPAGTEKVLTAGYDGELLRTADITYVNGKESRRVILSETCLREPVTETVAVGTGEAETLLAAESSDMPVIGDNYIILPTGEVLTYTHTDTVRATAYTHTDAGCDMTTSTGSTVRWGTVAVDPRYIPYGTRMFIMASDGSYIYGVATAEDCGGDIKGDRMDLYMPTYEQCREFGRRRCTLYFLV
jgi:3D (Asp-Asp-Asp) domain-containing protein